MTYILQQALRPNALDVVDGEGVVVAQIVNTFETFWRVFDMDSRELIDRYFPNAESALGEFETRAAPVSANGG